ncbi:hypothetical protein [Sphingobacterium sp. MYb388]|uniref:hypothetical protein n=1 Tax=Sphingobacterium sp. MYb388 TaxID=2745437 RepID=UPI00309553DD
MKKILCSSRSKLVILLVSVIIASIFGYSYGLHRSNSEEKMLLADSMSMLYDNIIFQQVMKPHISKKDSVYIGLYLGNSNCKNCSISDFEYFKSIVSSEHVLYFVDEATPDYLYNDMKGSRVRSINNSPIFKTSNSLVFLVIGDNYLYPFSIDHDRLKKTEEYLALLNEIVK